MADPIKLDLKGRKILAELDWDARLSNTAIAKKVGLSKKAVEYRIKQFEKQGIIQGYYPVINFFKLTHYPCRIFVKLQNANEKVRKEINDYLMRNDDFK